MAKIYTLIEGNNLPKLVREDLKKEERPIGLALEIDDKNLENEQVIGVLFKEAIRAIKYYKENEEDEGTKIF